MKHFIILFAVVFALPLAAHAATKEQQRENIRAMHRNTLNQLYQEKPETVSEIRDAAGYAVFTSADVVALLVSAGFGHGVAYDNRTGRETFMKMASAGVGVGLGAKDFYTIFIFNNEDSFHDFITTGLDLSGQVDLAAKQGVKGGAATAAEDILPGVKIYQMTDTGLVAQLMLKGTKYWQDSELNDYSPRTEVERLQPDYNQ